VSTALHALYVRADRMARQSVAFGWTADDLAHDLRETALLAAHEWTSLSHPGPLGRFVRNRLKDHLAYVQERAERGLPPASEEPEWSEWFVSIDGRDLTPGEAQYHHGVRRGQ
jgi:DNA-directed RNA polymerase specialized sigma24 family protein